MKTAVVLIIFFVLAALHQDFWTWNNPEQEAELRNDSVARCLADMSGGLYVKADTVQELVEALNATLGCPIYGMRPRDLTTLPG